MTQPPICNECQSSNIMRVVKQCWHPEASAWVDFNAAIRCQNCGAWHKDGFGPLESSATEYLRGLRDARQVALDHMMAYGFAIAAKIDVMINRAASIPPLPTEPQPAKDEADG